MALRKAIVLVNGEFEQLQSGDRLSSTDVQSLTNKNANTVTIGQPVYSFGNDQVDLAKADASATKNVIGLVADVSIAANASGIVQSDGLLTATTEQWDAVTGANGGLTFGAAYYLDDATAGLLTVTPPSTGGSYVAKVGTGLSATEMEIEIQSTVKL